MIRPVTPADTPTLLDVAVATGLFARAEADDLLGGILSRLHAGELGAQHHAHAWVDDADGAPVGWVYFSPDEHAEGVWELWWIGVDPRCHGQGVGAALLRFVEDRARAADARVLVIETSSLAPLERTRRFYATRGYAACGTVPDYYADGDGKVIFARRLIA
jgi:ribosomal protein S18 acetylase RimI-like enzyme